MISSPVLPLFVGFSGLIQHICDVSVLRSGSSSKQLFERKDLISYCMFFLPCVVEGIQNPGGFELVKNKIKVVYRKTNNKKLITNIRHLRD